MLTTERLSSLRLGVFGVTGLLCLAYALLALAQGRPDPMPFWLPGLFGLGSAALLMMGGALAGKPVALRAFDEGHAEDQRRALAIAYWVALWLYPAFGLALWAGWIAFPVAFAAMGTLTGAAFLLLSVLFDLRGRA